MNQPNENGPPVYACTALYQGSYVPGYATTDRNWDDEGNGCSIYDPVSGQPQLVNPFYVAVPFWVNASGGAIAPAISSAPTPAWANPIGAETDSQTHYICRASVSGGLSGILSSGLIPGEVSESLNACVIAFDGVQKAERNYQVLSYGFLDRKPKVH